MLAARCHVDAGRLTALSPDVDVDAVCSALRAVEAVCRGDASAGEAARVYEALLRQGVIVRPIAGYGMPEHLRVTVGLPEQNERFLASLGRALAGKR